MIIEDGTGTGRKVGVSLDNRLETTTVTEPRLAHESKKHENSYSWTSVSADIDAGDTALWVANTSTTKDLHISSIYVWADVATQFKIHVPAYPATPAGTAVVGNNLNRTSGVLAEALAYTDESANAFSAANVILTLRNNEVGTDQFGVLHDFSGSLILGYRNAVAVDIIAESGAFECTIFGYFEDKA